MNEDIPEHKSNYSNYFNRSQSHFSNRTISPNTVKNTNYRIVKSDPRATIFKIGDFYYKITYDKTRKYPYNKLKNANLINYTISKQITNMNANSIIRQYISNLNSTNINVVPDLGISIYEFGQDYKSNTRIKPILHTIIRESIKLIKQVQRFQEKLFIHGDITPMNVLINSKKGTNANNTHTNRNHKNKIPPYTLTIIDFDIGSNASNKQNKIESSFISYKSLSPFMFLYYPFLYPYKQQYIDEIQQSYPHYLSIKSIRNKTSFTNEMNRLNIHNHYTVYELYKYYDVYGLGMTLLELFCILIPNDSNSSLILLRDEIIRILEPMTYPIINKSQSDNVLRTTIKQLNDLIQT